MRYTLGMSANAMPSRALRIGAAVVLGLLVAPSRVGTVDAPVLAYDVPCTPPDELLTDIDAGASQPLPDVFPGDWRKAPCPQSPRVRTVRGHCFAYLGPPPCDVGFEVDGECLSPAIARARPPSAIERTPW